MVHVDLPEGAISAISPEIRIRRNTCSVGPHLLTCDRIYAKVLRRIDHGPPMQRLILLTALVSLLFAGCSRTGFEPGLEDDDGVLDGGGDANVDAGEDTSRPDIRLDTPVMDAQLDEGGPDVAPPDVGPTCPGGAPECQRSRDCRDSGIPNAVCDDGCCVTNPDQPCRQAFIPCSSRAQSSDDFICSEDVGLCLPRCRAGQAFQTESEDCPNGSWCFETLQSPPDFDPGLNGACVQSTCGSIFGDDCGGETCLPLGNNASFCAPTGRGGVGDSCAFSWTDPENNGPLCRQGLLCVAGTCLSPCDLSDGRPGCDGNQECVEVVDTTRDNTPGVCGIACDPFSEGQCPGGLICRPVAGTFDLLGGICVEQTGDGSQGDPCEPEVNNCGEGLSCVNLGSDPEPEFRCAQWCDPLEQRGGELARCQERGTICVPSGLDEIGFCAEECEPYPRSGPGQYGCEEPEWSCFPFVQNPDEPTEAVGYCRGPLFGPSNFDRCDENFQFICEDYQLCGDVDLDQREDPVCLPLCEPFSEGQCGDFGVCNPIFPLFGTQSIATCSAEFQPGRAGDPCDPFQTVPCEEDGTLCLDTGQGGLCVEICRGGFDDCDFGSCQTGIFGPESGVPDYMGICN